MDARNEDKSYPSLFESLEDRVLFDGVPDAQFVFANPNVDAQPPAQVQHVQQQDAEVAHELVIVDAGVENYDELVLGLVDSRKGVMFEFHVLEEGADGIEQISRVLDNSDSRCSMTLGLSSVRLTSMREA